MGTGRSFFHLLALATAGGSLGCGLIAGLTEYHLGGAGSTGTGGGSSSGPTSSGTTASATGSGGGPAGLPGKWPDSASSRCLDASGMAFASSCTDTSSETYGQDATFAIYPPTYTVGTNSTVKDSVTGLTWYQTSLKAATWSNAVQACQTSVGGGMKGWRLPTRLELVSILDTGHYDPDLDTTAFPDFADGDFWSSTGGPPGTTWVVQLNLGEQHADPSSVMHFQLCVQGPLMAGQLAAMDMDTAFDSRTGLLWQRGTVGTNLTWPTALTTCELTDGAKGDEKGWRLPTAKELLTIVDETATPAIDTTMFPGAVTMTPYWTASTYSAPEYEGTAYAITFQDGSVERYTTDQSFAVRCVKTVF